MVKVSGHAGCSKPGLGKILAKCVKDVTYSKRCVTIIISKLPNFCHSVFTTKNTFFLNKYFINLKNKLLWQKLRLNKKNRFGRGY